MSLKADFDGFYGREEKLKGILRYNMERRTPMFYRTNLLLHCQRVNLLVEDILEIVSESCENFNSDKALTLALVHDDAEIVTGDVQLYYKEKMKYLVSRKKEMVAQLSKALGRTIKPYTMGLVMAPSGRADVFLIPGFHTVLKWKQYAVDKYYIGTFSPEVIRESSGY